MLINMLDAESSGWQIIFQGAGGLIFLGYSVKLLVDVGAFILDGIKGTDESHGDVSKEQIDRPTTDTTYLINVCGIEFDVSKDAYDKIPVDSRVTINYYRRIKLVKSIEVHG